MSLRNIYLAAAILGAAIPIVFFVNFAMAEGINLIAFIQGLFVNGAAGGFAADLLISSFVFWIYMFSRKHSGPSPGLLSA